MFHRPGDLSEALALHAQGGWTPLMGGTDVFPALVDRPPLPLLDLTHIDALRGIAVEKTHVRIGAATTWTDIIRAPLPPAFDMLKQAARQVGSVQIQNRATLGGNLCNASPAADGVPPLLALDASVELASPQGTREMPLAEFLRGNRVTARATDELLVAIHIPRAGENAGAAFEKLGARKYLVISIVMVAATLQIDADVIRQARIAVGSASAVAKRLHGLEERLTGLSADTNFAAVIMNEDLAALSPIDDVRATAHYRLDAAREMIARTLLKARNARQG